MTVTEPTLDMLELYRDSMNTKILARKNILMKYHPDHWRVTKANTELSQLDELSGSLGKKGSRIKGDVEQIQKLKEKIELCVEEGRVLIERNETLSRHIIVLEKGEAANKKEITKLKKENGNLKNALIMLKKLEKE